MAAAGGAADAREPVPGPVPRKVVLLGNPNVGKSASSTPSRGCATVSNYPGTTVEVMRGRLADGGELIDSPGLNSLLPLSEDERVSWELVRSVRGDECAVVVQVADARTCATRSCSRRSSRSSRSGPCSCSTCTTRPRRAGSGSTSRVSRRRSAFRSGRRSRRAGGSRERRRKRSRRRACRATTGRLPDDLTGPALAMLTASEAPSPPAAGEPARPLPRALLGERGDAREALRLGRALDGARVSRRLGRLAVHPL